jgi:hypothetical protein
MIGEWWIGKDLEGKHLGLMQGILLVFAWRNWEKPRKTCQGSWSPGTDVNPVPPEYEAAVLYTTFNSSFTYHLFIQRYIFWATVSIVIYYKYKL